MTKRHVTPAVFAICSVLLLFSFVPEARAFDEPSFLARRIRPVVVKGGTVDRVLGTLSSDYGIPIGIELGDEKHNPLRKIDLNLPETTVKDFLDAVVAKDPRYTWKLEGGVIHFRPSTARDALLTTLLDTKISHFAFAEGSTSYGIFSDILQLPEVGSKLVVADVAHISIIIGSMQRVGKGVPFEESNLTMRELLDRIILKTDIKHWVLMRWGKNGEYITLRS